MLRRWALPLYLGSISIVAAAPVTSSNYNAIAPTPLSIAGSYEPYNTQRGPKPPFPGTVKGALPPTTSGPPAPDDQLWQNLLSAEWVIYNFYQQGVEAFNTTSFTSLGFPNTTYTRLQEIRDNEAGHLEIFYSEISNASTKPGPCRYDYNFKNDPTTYLEMQVLIEVSSMAFLTGFTMQAKESTSHAALTAVAEVESRHNSWALMDIWNTNPFSGPIDTVYPYANQILQLTNNFVIDGSCPKENPPYPNPNQHLPLLEFNSKKSRGRPGEELEYVFKDTRPKFESGKEYYAVFFHGARNVTMPLNTTTLRTKIPEDFDLGKGIVMSVIADTPGAPTEDTVIAGPSIILEQPERLSTQIQ